jgi:flagellum-specific peptidoglycan hydrolase FlgJ
MRAINKFSIFKKFLVENPKYKLYLGLVGVLGLLLIALPKFDYYLLLPNNRNRENHVGLNTGIQYSRELSQGEKDAENRAIEARSNARDEEKNKNNPEPANKPNKPDNNPKKYGTGDDSEFAPANPDDIDELSAEEYIKKYKNIAIKEMRRTGVPASITLAQAIIESRSGNSRLAKNLNNHFGIKCHSRTCKAGHCKNYTDDSHKDFFRNFKTVEDSYKSHSFVVLKPRYTNRLNGKKDYKTWAYALQNGGYATGKNYASKLMRIIDKYKLYKYDK